jgi:hypothetical protein
VGKAVKKSSEEALNQALDKLVMVCPNKNKLVMVCPNKKTYDELTSLMFQLYCGNDFGLGNFSLSFLEKIENRWATGRKAAAAAKGLKLVVKNV